jgi:Ca2+-binding RTX toxin-like protein
VTDGSAQSNSTAVTVNVADANDNDSFPAGSTTGTIVGSDVYGTGGTDIVDMSGQNGSQTIYGGGGNDALTAGQGQDVVYGGSGDDTIHGSNQRDTFYGGSGNDTIYGDDQTDVIVGGLGADTLAGGAMDDTFKFLSVLDSRPGTAVTYDTITDFTRNNPGTNGDTLDLDAVDGLNFLQGLLTGTTLSAHSVGWVINGTTVDVYANTTNSTQTVGGPNAPDMQIHLTNVQGAFNANSFLPFT